MGIHELTDGSQAADQQFPPRFLKTAQEVEKDPWCLKLAAENLRAWVESGLKVGTIDLFHDIFFQSKINKSPGPSNHFMDVQSCLDHQ